MRVKLKYAFYGKGRHFKPGVIDPWPDGLELPKTATIDEEEKVPQEDEAPEEPKTLSEMADQKTQKGGAGRKPKARL